MHPCLVTLDTDTGAATTIGCSSSGASHFLTIDPEDGTLYSQSISRSPDPGTNALRRWVQDSNTLAWSDVVSVVLTAILFTPFFFDCMGQVAGRSVSS